MTHRRLIPAVCVAAATIAAPADPLRVTNTTPVAVIAAPPVAEPARLLDAAVSEWSLVTDWSSHATVSTTASEEIVLDGETFALTARWRRGAGRWQWGAEIGYVFQGGGVLDNFIDEYHDLFGFPEGDRPVLESDRLDYVYRRDGVTLLDVSGSRDGVTDLRLGAAWQAHRDPSSAVALRASLKLPTGDSDDLAGSGGIDISLSVDASRRVSVRSWTPQLYGGLGIILSDDGDVLSSQRNNEIVFAHAGVAWPVNDAITLNLQFDAHSAYYDSALPELGNALQIGLGGLWRIAADWDLEIAVVEDISTHSSPDVIFHFDLRHRRR